MSKLDEIERKQKRYLDGSVPFSERMWACSDCMDALPDLLRLARAVEEIASQQPEQPRTDDYEQDDMGARMHAVVMERWRICESLREALSSLQAQPTAGTQTEGE